MVQAPRRNGLVLAQRGFVHLAASIVADRMEPADGHFRTAFSICPSLASAFHVSPLPRPVREVLIDGSTSLRIITCILWLYRGRGVFSRFSVYALD